MLDWPETPSYVLEVFEPFDWQQVLFEPVELLLPVLLVLLWATSIAGTHKPQKAAVSRVFFIVLPSDSPRSRRRLLRFY